MSTTTKKSLEDYYNNKTSSLEQYYSNQLKEAEQKKQADKQTAAVNYEMLMKYLPAQQKAQGISNLGLSETSKVNAMNNYQNNLSSIESAYNTNKATLEENKNTAMTTLEENKINALNTQEENDYNKLKTILDSNDGTYQNRLDLINNSDLTDENKSLLSNYIKDSNYVSVNDEAKTLVNEALKRGYPDEQEAVLEYLENNKEAIGSELYEKYKAQLTTDDSGNAIATKSYKESIPKFYVQGLGSGITNDDVDITLGDTKRNASTEFDLSVSDEVADEGTSKILNSMTTGDENIPASPSQIVVYKGKAYIKTKNKGWKALKSDVSTVESFIQKYEELRKNGN